MKNELDRFAKILSENEQDIGLRKIANIVRKHYQTLIPLGTAGAKRAQEIIKIAQLEWDTTASEFEFDETVSQDNGIAIKQLHSIEIGPFRGFSMKEQFDLNSKIILIYGPNGTGKSSFCEALEFGLIGSVEESQAKRFKNPSDYFKNAHVKRYIPPTISGINSNGEIVKISPSEEQFRFSFVEKNRIDQFSRIAAFAPAKQTELIASLFGLESFNEFTRNFTSELDGKYIDLIGLKSLELEKRQAEILQATNIIAANSFQLTEQEKNETILANKYLENITLNEFAIKIGATDEIGEIQILEKELAEPIPSTTGIRCSEFESKLIEITDNHTQLIQISEKLISLSDSISYKSIYEAVIELGKKDASVCPACKTSISKTEVNPFLHAENELSKLLEIDSLQSQKAECNRKELEKLRLLRDTINKAIANLEPRMHCESVPVIPENIDWDWINAINSNSDSEKTVKKQLERIFYLIENRDKEIETAQNRRDTITARLKELRNILGEYQSLKGSRTTLESASIAAKKQIEEFQNANSALIESVEKEKSVVERNKLIATSYKKYVHRLNEYKESLPLALVADLGETIVLLYNKFNKNDAQSEKIKSIRLPTTSGDRIEIEFNGNEGVYQDALHILSEGHIRCIGLSILLAKNLKEGSPILIFDDPVNAIDSEHREAIRSTLFQDAEFDNTQIILTCHGEEFFKDIQAYMPMAKAKKIHAYTFLPKNGEKHIQVDSKTKPRNYVLIANELFSKGEVRDSLMTCRRALEALNIRTWEYFRKNNGGTISISFRQYNQSWDTRNLSENLLSKIRRDTFIGRDKEKVIESLAQLLGVSGDSREWRYLNKGTHEEINRDEFDRETVKILIDAVTKLDALVP